MHITGFLPQTNIVRDKGQRGVLQTVIKNGSTSIPWIIDQLKANDAGAAALPHQRA